MLLRKILAHSCIVLGGMFLTFSIINYFNDAMNFIGNDISLTLLFIWSILSMVTSGLYVAICSAGKNALKASRKAAKAAQEAALRGINADKPEACLLYCMQKLRASH